MSQTDQQKELNQHQAELSQNQTEHQAGVRMATKEQQKTLQNPQFLQQLQEADVDTDLFDWLEDEIGVLMSGSTMKGVRGEHYAEQQELLVKNAIERVIAEHSPGRLLRENPRMHAQMQGVQATETYPEPDEHPQYTEPMTSKKRRALRQALEAIVNHQSLSIGGRGIDAVANATVERRNVQHDETEASGVTGRLRRVFK